MKLYQIWNAKGAWGTLSALKKNPKLAYRLLKYEKKVSAELETSDKQRQAYVYEAAGVEPGQPVNMKPNTPELAAFVAKFNEFMAGDADLEWIGLSMDDLIEALDAEKGNVLSERDIELLEPFFTEPKKEA